MRKAIVIAYKTRERDALLRLAGYIVEAGSHRGRSLSRGEDAMVTGLTKRARALEDEIQRLQRDTPSTQQIGIKSRQGVGRQSAAASLRKTFQTKTGE
jgi:hypothetical protein